MADNILTKDRADANLDIAAKDIGGVQHPRNIIVDPSGNDIAPAYAPVPAPEYWAAKEKRRRRNVALLLALGH